MNIAARIAALDWMRIADELGVGGSSRIPALLSSTACARLIALYNRDALFRATINMTRYRFGSGEYRYFTYPLPPPIQTLRQAFYGRLAPVANLWAQQLRRDRLYPARLDDFLHQCHAAGQTRPTPLLLRYGGGDYNCLHQDVYGALGFPLQVLVVLSQRGEDYEGGEVVLLEQRPRAQSEATVCALDRGDALIFTNRERPVRGSRGYYTVQMRHGASVITRGERYVLGIIFHDAT